MGAQGLLLFWVFNFLVYYHYFGNFYTHTKHVNAASVLLGRVDGRGETGRASPEDEGGKQKGTVTGVMIWEGGWFFPFFPGISLYTNAVGPSGGGGRGRARWLCLPPPPF